MQEIFPYLTPKVRSDLIRWSLYGDFRDVNHRMIRHHDLEISQEDLNKIGSMLGIPIPGMCPQIYAATLDSLEKEVARAKRRHRLETAAVARAVQRALNQPKDDSVREVLQ